MARQQQTQKQGFPWLPLVLLAVSIVIFWVIPYVQKGNRLQLQFDNPPEKSDGSPLNPH